MLQFILRYLVQCLEQELVENPPSHTVTMWVIPYEQYIKNATGGVLHDDDFPARRLVEIGVFLVKIFQYTSLHSFLADCGVVERNPFNMLVQIEGPNLDPVGLGRVFTRNSSLKSGRSRDDAFDSDVDGTDELGMVVLIPEPCWNLIATENRSTAVLVQCASCELIELTASR
jgi:hypothetical protein